MSKDKFEIGDKLLVPCGYSGKRKKECTITHINEEKGRICVKDKRSFGSCWDVSQVTHFRPLIILSNDEIKHLEEQMLAILYIPVDSLTTSSAGTDGNVIHALLD